MGGTCSTYGGRRGIYRVLVEKLEGKGLLGKRRLEGNMKMDHQEVGMWGHGLD
jgi:hypothetical protein